MKFGKAWLKVSNERLLLVFHSASWASWIHLRLIMCPWWQLIANLRNHEHQYIGSYVIILLYLPKPFASNSSWFDDRRLIRKYVTQEATNFKFGKSQALENWIRCKHIALPPRTFPHHNSWFDAVQWQWVLITNWGELLQISGERGIVGCVFLCAIYNFREPVLFYFTE